MEFRAAVSHHHDYDVVVCGAGPSGIAAALTTARQGLRTALLERYGAIGGNLTMANVTTIMGSVSRGTITDEICALLRSPDPGTATDPEYSKEKLIELVSTKDLDLYLQCAVIGAEQVGEGSRVIYASSQDGIQAFTARRVIDATGDGYVAALSGATVMKGRPGDDLLQPTSILYHIDGVKPGTTMVCRHEEDDTLLPGGESYLQLCKRAAREGILPEHVTIVRLYPTIRPGEYLVNATQANGIDGTRLSDVAKAEKELRHQVRKVTDFLKKYVPGFEDIRVRVSASTLGVRETRRIKGLHILHDDDLVAGRRFEDVVVHKANFVIDIHNPTGGGQAETEGCPHKVSDYDIPMRSLQPEGVENLIITGRCISGTHRAHASYRVMRIAMALGQAAGAMATVSLRQQKPVSKLVARDVQELLTGLGCDLFGEDER